MTLVMTLLVRDEEDILEANMRYHLEKGVDHIIVTDNLSVDATPQIVEEFVKQRVATYIHEPEDTYSQSRWVTRMAHRAARELGARWVMHADADEFWMTPECGDLGRFFDGLKWPNIVVAPRHDFICLEGEDGPFWQRMIYAKTRSLNPLGRPLPPKVAHRASPRVKVAMGNHSVSGLRWPRRRTHGIEILHFPLRSRRQYLQKITNGGKAYGNNTELPQSAGSTWRQQYRELQETGKLAFVEDNLVSAEDCARQLAAGEVREDTRLRDFFRARAS